MHAGNEEVEDDGGRARAHCWLNLLYQVPGMEYSTWKLYYEYSKFIGTRIIIPGRYTGYLVRVRTNQRVSDQVWAPK